MGIEYAHFIPPKIRLEFDAASRLFIMKTWFSKPIASAQYPVEVEIPPGFVEQTHSMKKVTE